MTVPFLFGCLVTTPETYHQAGIRRGTVTQRSTLRGTTSRTSTFTSTMGHNRSAAADSAVLVIQPRYCGVDRWIEA
jgi:hypothetical protein